MLLQKLKYLIRSILNFSQPKQCPNCRGLELKNIDSKYLVTILYKCDTCKLNFRFPVDSKEFLEKFYQSEYQADYSDVTREITHLPLDEELNRMKENNFYGKRDYSPFVKALFRYSAPKILDYGCSWGYSVFQMKKAGYDAEGFEISKVRAAFGKKLDVMIHNSEDTVRDNNDLIISSHTIEHLRVVSDFIEFSSLKLNKEGIFMAFCPNGSDEYRKREPDIFHVNWGFLHPNYLDIEFAAVSFVQNPYLILTGDWKYDTSLLSSWDGHSQIIGNKRDGKELLIIAKPNIFIQ